MINYAMIPINIKEEDDGLHVRRVLISYEQSYTLPPIPNTSIIQTVYKGTKLIAVDPYFEDEEKSHQYKFEDDGYTLLEANNDNGILYALSSDIYLKRVYHSYSPYDAEAILFEAKTDKSAIKKFNERVELRS